MKVLSGGAEVVTLMVLRGVRVSLGEGRRTANLNITKGKAMTARIVVVGSFNMDLTAYIDRLPRPGETRVGSRFVAGPGGKGSNQAVAAARLGAEVTFIGRIGTDIFGETALKTWQQEGINTRYVVRDPDNATGVAPIWVSEETGENTIIVVLGANLALCPEDIDAAAEAIARADVLVTQLEGQPETMLYALEVARKQGVRTILNPAPAAPVSIERMENADIITPNETELEVLVGSHGGALDDAARSLLVRDDQLVLVTLGARGARRVSRSEAADFPAFKVTPVDTTGAGDAFNGGLAVALAEGREIDEAIRFASATAALSVTRPGTTASMPMRAEVDALIAAS
jgi:ribokinase